MKNTMLFVYSFLFCLLPAIHTKGQNIDKNKIVKIVAFGNSTTAYRKSIDQVYAERLPGMLMKEGIPAVVYNSGIGGSHTGRLADNSRHRVSHALDRFEEDVLGHDPHIVTICFGINDSFYDKGKAEPRIPISRYEANLDFMIKELMKREIDVILMTPNALGKKHSKKQYQNTAKYVDVVRSLSRKYELPLIDQWKIFEEYASETGKEIDDLLLDGTHPSQEWHTKWAELIMDEVKEIIHNKNQK